MPILVESLPITVYNDFSWSSFIKDINRSRSK
jgi:hypothetical protein